jgi:hypothetical protein
VLQDVLRSHSRRESRVGVNPDGEPASDWSVRDDPDRHRDCELVLSAVHLNVRIDVRKVLLAPTVLLVAMSLVAAAGQGIAFGAKPAAGPHVPKKGGSVIFTGYSDNDGPKSVIVLSGVIGDYGSATRTSTSNDGAFTQLLITVTKGSFRLDIAGIEDKLAKAIYGHFPTNPATCSGQVSIDGTTPIVGGSGTGSYKGITGTFTTTITINEVEDWPNCPETDTSPFLAQTVFLSGNGVVYL